MPWWKRCCGDKLPSDPESDKSKRSANQTINSRLSAESMRSEEEVLAAIEAEVDDSLEVLSNRSGEIIERHSSLRSSSSYRHGRSISGSKRGFGLHVDLSGQRSMPNNGGANTVVYTPRSESGDANYLAAPYSPQTPSPHSVASSAYFSNALVDEKDKLNTRDFKN